MISSLHLRPVLDRQNRCFRRCIALAACLFFVISGTGCRGQRLFPVPGPILQQQASAVVHDPYPARDIAPEDLGARPPGYENPLPEPVRNRLVRDSMPWLGR
jgi:hypothetical protein